MTTGDDIKISTSTLRANFSEFLGRVRWANETVHIVNRAGKLIAAIIPPKDLELLEAAKKAAAAATEHGKPVRGSGVSAGRGAKPKPRGTEPA